MIGSKGVAQPARIRLIPYRGVVLRPADAKVRIGARRMDPGAALLRHITTKSKIGADNVTK